MASDLTLATATGKVVNTIPRLLEGGANWVAYKERMGAYLMGQPGFRKHLRGRAKEPEAPEKPKDNATKAEKDAYEVALDTYEDKMDEWLQKEAAITNALISSWPEEVHQRLIGVRPVSALWDTLCARFDNQDVLVKTDLLMELTDTRCTSDDPEDALRTIDRLVKKRNEYIQAGGTLTTDIYAAILTKAMPKRQRPVVQTAITTAMAAGKELDFALVHRTLEQSIRFDLAEERREREEAMAMSAKFQRQQQSKGKKFCTNCKLDGHVKETCWRPGGGAEGQGPKGAKGGGGGKKEKGEAAAAQGSATGKTEHAAEDHAYLTAAIPAYALRAAAAEHETLRLLDTGASQHYDGNLANFVDIAPCEPYGIQTASGLQYATQIGTTHFACNQNGVKTFTLKNTYHLPECPTPLISLAKLRKHGLVFSNAEDGYGTLTDVKTGKQILRVAERDGVYPLTTWRPESGTAAGAAHAAGKPLTRTEAHERLGHMAHTTIETLARNGAALNFDVDLSTPIVECEVCTRAKTQGVPIAQRHRDLRENGTGERTTGDLRGPPSATAKGGYKYYDTHLDAKTNIAWLWLQKTEDAGEFLRQSRRFATAMKAHGANIKLQGNGATTRLNEAIGGHARAMLLASGLPQSFWALAVLYAVWLRNRAPTRQTGPRSPYEVMTGKRPDLKRARGFGSKVWVRENEGVWVGPSSTPDGHKVYWPGARTTTVERNVRFEDGTEFGGEPSAEIPVEVPNSGQHKSTESGAQRTSEPPTNTSMPRTSYRSTSAPTSPKETPTTAETEPAREASAEMEDSTLMVEDVATSNEPDALATPEDVDESGEGVTSGAGGQYRKYTRGLQVPNADRHERAQKAYAVSTYHRGERQSEGESADPDLKTVGEEEKEDAQHRSHVNVKARTFRTSSAAKLEWRTRRASTPQVHPQDVDRRGTRVLPFPEAFRRGRRCRSNTK
ncbi:Transcription factor [Mycena venus]|uniref:Transcription factor n=1 Tax=Mycena venus TaxID=2733690 RepID=A0A8H6Y8J4_9AGAR|nr:Transcription factor [Mycena venus]